MHNVIKAIHFAEAQFTYWASCNGDMYHSAL